MFRERPVEPGKYPFLMLDATYFKAREDHRVKSIAFMIAIGITGEGNREVLGFSLYGEENNFTWTSFIQELKARGLDGVMMFTSDAHPSIRHAMQKEFPDAVWQRCQFHFIRNILDAAPENQKAGIESEIREMFNCDTIKEARKRRDEILRDYSDVKVFPNPDSIIRLIGSVTIDYSDALLSRRKLFYSTTMSKITEKTKVYLVSLAHEQAQRASSDSEI